MSKYNYNRAFAQDGLKTDISDADYKGGWYAVVGGINGIPTTQQFNTIMNEMEGKTNETHAMAQSSKEKLEQLEIVDEAVRKALDNHVSDKNNPHETDKEQVGLGNVPNVTTNDQTPTYTVPTSASELTSGEKLSTAFGKIARAVKNIIAHIANKNNPHNVTKAQVGLGQVDNTSDVNKPVSGKQQVAIDAAYYNSNLYTDEKIADLINGAPTTMDTLKEIADAMAENADVVEALEKAIGVKANENEFDSHVTDKNNPHNVTKAQVGLDKADNTADADKSVKYATTAGSANAVAWESITGKPSAYPPSAHSHSDKANLEDAFVYRRWLTDGEDVTTLQCGSYTCGPDNIPSIGIPSGFNNYGSVSVFKNSHYSLIMYRDVFGNIASYASQTNKWVPLCNTSELSNYLPLTGGRMTGDLYVRNGKKIFVDNGSSIGVGGWFYSSGKNTYIVSNTNGSSDSYLQLQANSAVQCLAVGQENTFVPCNASSHPNMSSRRYKDNIKPLTEEEALKILEVETVTYDYKEGVVLESERYDKRGVIAEDVADIIPSAVLYKNVEGIGEVPDSVDYSKFIPYLIKMVQMQQNEINELKKELAELKNQLEKERN